MDVTPATPTEALAIHQTVAHLRARVTAAGAFRSTAPAPGSPLASDFASGHGQDLMSHALIWTLSADGHLMTMASAISTGELHAFGLYSLVRGAAEPLARLTWLFDASATSAQRHQRLLGERLANQLERRKLKAFRKHADDRIHHITKVAAKAGFKPTPSSGRPEHFGQPRPSSTTLFARVLAKAQVDPAHDPVGELLYRMLSGHAHSMMYALMANADVSGPHSGPVTRAWVELNAFQVLSMLDLVLRMYETSQECWCRMTGVDVSAWHEVLSGLPPTADLEALFRDRLG
ncbi:MAG: hypothetical protein M3082_13645 [Candidatus Dormibacteraeota bacterium]|nr:hypothetical protein [Candidatus Dormibacteraeota bacterium]